MLKKEIKYIHQYKNQDNKAKLNSSENKSNASNINNKEENNINNINNKLQNEEEDDE